MSWFFEKRSYSSAHQSEITAIRKFGSWEVFSGGFCETTSFIISMWESLLHSLPADISGKRILVLGLAGGGLIPLLRKKFPGCHITAVELDAVMVQVFHETTSYSKKGYLDILIGDATQVVPALKETFDLVIFDMFTGADVPIHVQTQKFFSDIAQIMTDDGACLVNAYRCPTLIENMMNVFRLRFRAKFLTNEFGVLHTQRSRKGLPQEFVPLHATRAWLDLAVARLGTSIGSVVGTDQALGLRWKVGPITIEKYISDTQPVLLPVKGLRFVLWQPVTYRGIIPKGWMRGIPGPFISRTGMMELDKTTPERDWDAHALRHLRKWKKNTEWHIEHADAEAFLAAYMLAPQSSSVKQIFASTIRSFAKQAPERVEFFVARRVQGGPVEAGFASLHVPEYHMTHHITSFILKSAKGAPVGIGLIDAWRTRAVELGFRFADFGGFWKPGEPSSWKGFSRFKSQFGVTFIDFPRSYLRCTLK